MEHKESPIVGLPLYRPMMAVAGTPFDSPDYIYEVKWDGIRCLAYLGEETYLFSRNANNLTYHYPELKNLHQVFTPSTPLVLDGELVSFEGDKPSFRQLLVRNRLQNQASILQAATQSPAVLMVFDILNIGGKSLLNLPLLHRKQLLADYMGDHPALRLCDYLKGEGTTFFQAVSNLGLEGMVAKQIDSLYYPGKRSQFWKKIKSMQEEDLVVCGYTPGKGRCQALGSLILGGYRDGVLTYAGLVGSGLSHSITELLLELLKPLESAKPSLNIFPSLNQPVWVIPRLVCTVSYLERSSGGELRHSSFIGLRQDKEAEECLLT